MEYGYEVGIASAVIAAISLFVAIRNYSDARKYRLLDRPWAELEHQSGLADGTHRYASIGIVNDAKGLWRLSTASVIKPGYARLAIEGAYDTDQWGSTIAVAGEWGQNVSFSRQSRRLFVKPTGETVDVLITIAGRADPSQTSQWRVTIPGMDS